MLPFGSVVTAGEGCWGTGARRACWVGAAAAGVVAIPGCCGELVALLPGEVWDGGELPWMGWSELRGGGVGGWEAVAVLLVSIDGGVGAVVCTVGGGLGGPEDGFTGVKLLLMVGAVGWVR